MAAEFGVIETAPDGSVVGFHEKRADAPTMPGDPDRVYASMGNYIFSTNLLLRELYADAENENSSHDFGRDILPSLVGRAPTCSPTIFRPTAFPAIRSNQEPYWRDVGTIDAYYDANMDLRAVTPALNLYNRQWPLRTAGYFDAPAKFIFDEEGRRGKAIDSIVAGGSILSGGMVQGSVMGRGVRVHSGAVVEDSIMFDNCDIGRRARCAGRFSTRTSDPGGRSRSATTWMRTGSCITSRKAESWWWKGTGRRWTFPRCRCDAALCDWNWFAAESSPA